jgi:hypothetical protein
VNHHALGMTGVMIGLKEISIPLKVKLVCVYKELRYSIGKGAAVFRGNSPNTTQIRIYLSGIDLTLSPVEKKPLPF